MASGAATAGRHGGVEHVDSACWTSRVLGHLLIGVVAALVVPLLQQRRGRPGLLVPVLAGAGVTVLALLSSVLGDIVVPVAPLVLPRA